MTARAARARIGLALFFLGLVAAHGARDAALVTRWWDDFRAGRLSLGAPGREDPRNPQSMHEENILYLAGFRDAADGHVLPGDDYVYESKARRAPTPLVPQLIGATILRMTGLDPGWTVAVLHLAQAVSYVLLFVTMRAARLPPLAAAAVTAAALVLGQDWSLRSLVAKALVLDRINDALAAGHLRFIAPILTLPFFLLFLVALFRDPRLSRRRTAIAVGALAGLSVYVYYANTFVIGLFLPCYLAGLAWAWPEYRRHHALAALAAVVTIAPFAVFVIASRSWLPADYVTRAGTSEYGAGIHLATINPRVIATFIVLYSIVPIAAVLAAAWRSVPRETRAAGLRAQVRALAAGAGRSGSAVIVLAALSFIPSVVPSSVQFLTQMLQPSRVHVRLGATCNVMAASAAAWFIASRWAPQLVACRARPAVAVLVGLALVVVVGRRAREGWVSSTAPYEVAPAHAAVVAALRERTWPCVVASSSPVVTSLVTARTPCDALAPVILLSTVSIREAVDRHVASWVLEGRSRDEFLGYFRLRDVPRTEDDQPGCVGTETYWMTDGIMMTHHLAACRPTLLRATIIAIHDRYAAAPDEILRTYRVDTVYSVTGRLHPTVRARFEPGAVPGLFERRR